MARIENKDFNNAQVGNIEKINGDYFLKVIPSNSNGDFVSPGKLVTEPFDGIYASFPDTSTEVYTYKMGTDVVAIVTVTFTDSTKAVLVSVVRS